MWINVPSLQESLADADLYEFRQSQGKRYELQSVLLLSCVAMMNALHQRWSWPVLGSVLLLSCVAMMNGAQSEQEIADWCSRYGQG